MIEQVFVRHVFRFFMGRNENLGDAKTLQDAYEAYVYSNDSFQAIVISIVSSDSLSTAPNPSLPESLHTSITVSVLVQKLLQSLQHLCVFLGNIPGFLWIFLQVVQLVGIRGVLWILLKVIHQRQELT